MASSTCWLIGGLAVGDAGRIRSYKVSWLWLILLAIKGRNNWRGGCICLSFPRTEKCASMCKICEIRGTDEQGLTRGERNGEGIGTEKRNSPQKMLRGRQVWKEAMNTRKMVSYTDECDSTMSLWDSSYFPEDNSAVEWEVCLWSMLRKFEAELNEFLEISPNSKPYKSIAFQHTIVWGTTDFHKLCAVIS